MPLRPHTQRPRRLLVLFLGIVGVLAAALGWLGWQLLAQDRALADQQIRTQLEAAADAVTGELNQRIAEIEETLTAFASVPARERHERVASVADALAPGAVVVVLGDERVEAFPEGRLSFYPRVGRMSQPDPVVFARGEALEFRQRDYPAAIRTYRALAQSADAGARAGALLRLARVLRKAGRYEAALATYAELARMPDQQVAGLPAGLIGSYARLEVLQQLGRDRELAEDAGSFRLALASGTWRLTRAEFEFYHADVGRFLPDSEPPGVPHSASVALAGGVEALWEHMQAGTWGNASGGREVVVVGDRTVLLVWRPGAQGLAGFVATDRHVGSAWLADTRRALDQRGIALSLTDVAGSLAAPPEHDATAAILRVPAQTGLPWTMQVEVGDPGVVLADLGKRWRLMFVGLLLMVTVVVFGAYAITRAVRREMEVSRLQAEFVSAVSHEFRTPLTSMRQLTEMLAGDRVPNEERRAEYYRVISRESERLHRLVEGLLDFGRMEAGALEFTKRRIVVDDLVHDVVEEFRFERGEAANGVTTDGSCTGVVVNGDREALTRALWNLLDNALKYSPAGGDVHVGLASHGNRVSVSVRDHGRGMSPEDLDAVFEKFVRGSASKALNVKGTGIGLAMVRHIVEAHDGEVTVESVLSEGTTFTVRLPIEEAA